MKHLIYLFLALIATPLVPLTGCTSRAETDALATIERARALIDTLPDSSLHLLQSIPPGSLSSERSRALHALLLSQACDKNYIDISSDTLIRPALNYFTSHPDAENLPLAHYYAAIVYTNAADYSRALIHFKHAEALTDTANHILRGLIYRNISDILAINYAINDRLPYARLSLKEFQKSQQQKYSDYAAVALAAAMINVGITDGVIHTLDSVAESEFITPNHYLLAQTYRTYAQCYLTEKDYHSAYKYYEKALLTDSAAMGDGDITNMLGALSKISSSDTIYSFASRLSNRNLNANSFAIPLKRNDYKEAFQIILSQYLELDTIWKAEQGRKLVKTITDFDKARNIAENEQNRNNLTLLVWVSIALLIICVCAFAVAFYIRQRHCRLQNQMMIEAGVLRDAILQQQSERDRTDKLLVDALHNRIANLNDLLILSNKIGEDKTQLKLIQSAIQTEISGIRGDEILHKLENAINRDHNNVLHLFSTALNPISEIDYKLFVYSHAGASPVVISIILNCNIENIYLRRSRLKKKILTLPSEQQKIFMDILKR